MLPTIRKGENVSLPLLEAEPTLEDLNYRMAYEDNSLFLNGPPLGPGVQAGPRCGNCHRYSDGHCMLAAGRPRVDSFAICDSWTRSATDPMMGFAPHGAGPSQYDQQMPDYGEMYGVDALGDAQDKARSDAEQRRIAAAARLFTRYGFHGEAPGPIRVQDREGMDMRAEQGPPTKRASGQQKPKLFLRTGPMAKGGPYIGPRGGKWADPKQTIPWKEGGDRGAGQGEEPKRSYMSETFYHSSRKPLSELRQGKFSVTDDREASEEYLNEEEGHVYEVKVPDDLKLADDDEIKEIARELDPDTPYQRAYEHVDEEPEVMRELQRRGFDGIHIDDETPDNQREHKTITVFDPVKSGLVFREVTEKSGTMSLQSSINELETLLKAGPRGGKYYRRVPTGNPKNPWRYYYSKEQYERAHKDKAHVNGAEVKQAREKPKQIEREWVKGSDFGFGPTDEMHKIGGQYTADRKRLHEKIIGGFVDHVPSVPPNKKPVAVVTMGGPASGKGTVLRHILGDHGDLVNVNPDDVKEEIPEYKRMVGKENPKKTTGGKIVTAKDAAFLAHEESSDVSEQVMDRAIGARKNLILDGTGKNANKYRAKIQRLKDAGYHVRVVMPHVDLGEAHKRMKERANRSGRFVPEDIVEMAHHLIPGNFDTIQSVADEAVLFDNTRPPPRPVWSRKGSESTTHDEKYMDEFRKVSTQRHQAAREKGWMKSMSGGSKEPDLTLEEMLERMKRSKVGQVEDLSTGLDDFFEETREAMERDEQKKSLSRSLLELEVLIKKQEHPVSEAQRRWAFSAEERGELPKGTAKKWSRRKKGEDLPETTGKATEDLEDEDEESEGSDTEKSLVPNYDPRCLIHGYDPMKLSFNEQYTSCVCSRR